MGTETHERTETILVSLNHGERAARLRTVALSAVETGARRARSRALRKCARTLFWVALALMAMLWVASTPWRNVVRRSTRDSGIYPLSAGNLDDFFGPRNKHE